jgi:transposase
MLSPEEKVKLVEELSNEPKLLERLRELGVATSTYYSWKRRLAARGVAAFIAESSAPKSVWNRLSQADRDLIESEARKHTEMSPRLLAWMLLDEHGVAVSESTVYRVLKAKGLVRQRPLDQRPAAKVWKKPTKAVDEIWQMDGTNFFIPQFGYYKAIPVIDDHSRKVLACPLLPDESGQSASDAFEMAMEAAQREGHVIETRPTLLTDNGAGFSGEVLAKYLKARGVRHIFFTTARGVEECLPERCLRGKAERGVGAAGQDQARDDGSALCVQYGTDAGNRKLIQVLKIPQIAEDIHS